MLSLPSPPPSRGPLSRRPPLAKRSGARYPHGMAHQFVVQLAHKPGALAALCRELERQGVDLKAIGGGGIGEFGHVILKTADDVKTRAVLESGAYTYIESESVLAEVDDQPGGMLSVLDRLAAAGVNVYGHLFMGRWGERATFAFVVDDPAKARAALGQEY